MTPIDYDLLIRYVAGECPSFERAQVGRWFDESPHYAELARALREIASDDRSLTAERKAAMLAAVKQQGAADPAELPAASFGPARAGSPAPRTFAVRRGWPWSTTLRVAAVLALLAAAAAVGRLVVQPRASALPPSFAAGLRSFATAPGQRLAFRLPDGTAVTLAPASVLRLAADYGTRKRVVDLEGEAVFTVDHDPARPFLVRTSRGIARDLGTRFAVRAYPDDPTADVVVAEGVVAVWPDRAVIPQGDSVVLGPGDQARLTLSGQVTVSHGVVLDPYFAWITGRLMFRDTPLREAAARMSRWYDIDVRLVSPAIGDRLLTATFDERDAPDVLPLIAASLELELTQSGRTYTFHAR